MTLAIGDTAPDFEAETTEGKIRFHEWLGNSWGVLFSHPKDFTPVCTTELGAMARLKPEFDKRNTKIIGLSVDPVTNHAKWAVDIKDVVGFAPNYPMIGDTDLKIAKAYGMLPAATAGSSEGRTALRRNTAGARLAANDSQTPRGDAGKLETGRRRDHRRFGQRRRGQEDLSARLEGATALSAHRAATEIMQRRLCQM
jgi:peroxiredoxin